MAGDCSALVCDTSFATDQGFRCPSQINWVPDYSFKCAYEYDLLAYISVWYDNNRVKFSTYSCTSEEGPFGPTEAFSIDGFSGVDIIKNTEGVLVKLVLYNHFAGATVDNRYNRKWEFYPETFESTSTETYFCPLGTVIIGLFEKYLDKDKKKYNPTQIALNCVPYYCPATKYTKVNAVSYIYCTGENDCPQACDACPDGAYSLGSNIQAKQNFVTVCSQCTVGRPVGDTAAVKYTSNGDSPTSCNYTCNSGYGKSNSQGSSTECGKCNAGYYSPSTGTDCTICSAGSVSSNTGSSVCSSCTLGTNFQSLPGQLSCSGQCIELNAVEGRYLIPCSLVSNTQYRKCPQCSAGQYLSPACGRSDYSVPLCTNCPPGTYQRDTIIEGDAVSSKYSCTKCATGFYQNLAGQPACKNCANPSPANGQYANWGAADASSSTCPVQCNTGYGWTGSACVACPNGKYAVGGLPLVNCQSCTYVLGTTAYWLTPVVFNRGSDACPWDCKEGYYKVEATRNCVPCPYPTYSSRASLRLVDSKPPNRCVSCDTCVAKSTYESAPCLPTQNRTCSACTIQCQAGYYLTECNVTSNSACVSCGVCPSGKYIVGECSGRGYSNSLQCVDCSDPSICVSGLYMPAGQCPGTTRSNAVCFVCRSLACPFGTYQKACSQSTDTMCVAYTQCPAGQTLRNKALYNDGVCQQCTNCSVYGLSAIGPCSQYQDTLCSGTPCSGANPCANRPDRDFFCNMDAFGVQQAARNTTGVCGMCPDGYSSDGMYCYECPSTKTCSRTGVVRCVGEVSPGYEPWCYGEYAQPTGVACPFQKDPTRIVTRSTFVQPNGNCAPYFQCAPGYFKHFYSTGNVVCEACDASSLPAYVSWFSEGLSPNDPESCIYRCTGIASWPGGACSALPSTSYIPRNPPGYYDDGSGGQKRCPNGKTSADGKAVSESDCKPCPNPPGSLGDPCGQWTCQLGFNKIGDMCYDPLQCPPSMVGYSYADVSGKCVPTALPWQTAGYSKLDQTVSQNVLVRQANLTFSYPDSVTMVVTGGGPGAITFYSNGYGQSRRHWLRVNASSNVRLPGKVCSAVSLAIQGRRYAVVAFCNASFLSFLDLTLASPVPQLLIGSNASGYQEGFRDKALFRHALHLAVDGTGPSLYVSDSLNCALRLVSIPTVPGDFLTRSHWVYGASAGTCQTVARALLSPGPLFALLDQTYFIFPAATGVYQLDAHTRNVVAVLPSSMAPAWMPDPSLLLAVGLGGEDSARTYELVLRFASTAAVVTPLAQRCPDGFTSLNGSSCSTSCSLGTNYVDPTSGGCEPCYTRDCAPGEELVPCTPGSPQSCRQCPQLADADGKYPRIYNLAGSCAVSNVLYTTFCPAGMYLSSTLVRGARVCNSCPRFSTTDADGATSLEQCRCYEGTMRTAGGTCVVQQLYPLPTTSRCRFGTYQRGAFEQCSSCRLDPFPQCLLGQYPLSNGSCAPCLVPALAVPVRAGRGVNNPTSCGFSCLPGYFPYSNSSYLTQCQPCTNAPETGGSDASFYALTNGQLDSPRGCTWVCRFPYKIYNDRCIACTLVNPVDAAVPCTLPGWTVNSSAGPGATGVLGATRYRMIRFNSSGYIVFGANTTADLLLVGGGGASSQSLANPFMPGGAGGSGLVVVRFVDLACVCQ